VGSRVDLKESNLKQGCKLGKCDWKEVMIIYSIFIGIQNGNSQLGR
jgi:hypothetical protein